MEPKSQVTRWQRDFERFLPLKSQFVLSGNVRDLQVVEVQPGVVTAQPLNQCVAAALNRAGCANTILFQPLAGFSVVSAPGEAGGAAAGLLQELGLAAEGGQGRAGAELLASALDRIVRRQGEPIALIVDFAARLLTRPTDPTAAEHHLFTQALVLSQQAAPRPAGTDRRPFFNTVIWIVEKEGDLPDWFIVGNPRLRHIPVPRPDNRARRALAPALLKPLSGAAQAAPDSLKKAQDEFVDGTEGMLLVDVNAISVLARVEGVPFDKIADAVRRYKVGVTEDPWLQIGREKIKNAEAFIRQRVKGQPDAVVHMLDIVKRAVMGVGGGRRGGRPRGVAFLAGPTGVGKTELAKTVTSLLFGDESAYIRFDMSEFSAEHADQRLLGAPPGYIGYDAGGELTNAIREKPFSVVLFDEIEKAHPRVLDKFLQILDDGVLTSGRGDRVYFSEALIVFTSNLGIYKMTESGERELNVSQQEPYEAVKQKVESEIERHFKFVLNRPEILNRMGENIIVFDFIREDIAGEIFQQMVVNTLADLKSQELEVSLASEAMTSLRALCLADLSNGGRGIRNQVEAHLLNPLARALFDADAAPGRSYLVSGLQAGQLSLESAAR
ncbi:AAA family ATPase [Thauera aminoaromatica]|uniref:ATP-dependent Clp protease ATP-binding subunit n=1 Tax=Thauera aminoaromatica TaxID=164330 RepID=A0A5C7SJ11_THASP|nr:AAA family ATPase [Thauera aminoaromatica]TXH82956.1 MAG: ATP-dependent Clp protease ATP-binding subunit [Thauera aminoaromatica]